MRDSLRARLLTWYTAMLAVVIAVFGATVAYVAWRGRLAEIDLALVARAQALAGALEPSAGGAFDLTLPIRSATGSAGAGEVYHVLWDGQGRLIDRSDPDLEVPLPSATGERLRAGRREVSLRASSGPTVLVGRDLADVRAEIWALVATLAAVGVAALAVSLAGGRWLVGRALRPIERISATARRMTEGDLSARIPVERVETELGQLAGALNEAFDRMHAALARQRQFTTDASHELRTPLATSSTEAQWALGRERTPDEYRRALETCLRASARMQAVVDRLLALARAEAGAADEPVTDVRLDEIVRQAARDVAPLAQARGLDVRVETAPVTVNGSADRLLEAVTNLLTNAVQYNVEGGRVSVTLRATPAGAELVVADTGVGIQPSDLPRVFDPFFRADPARRRDPGGAGLGLAVTRSIVERCQGTIACSSEPDRGTTMTVRLPTSTRG